MKQNDIMLLQVNCKTRIVRNTRYDNNKDYYAVYYNNQRVFWNYDAAKCINALATLYSV
jgi:hypothetical protein